MSSAESRLESARKYILRNSAYHLLPDQYVFSLNASRNDIILRDLQHDRMDAIPVWLEPHPQKRCTVWFDPGTIHGHGIWQHSIRIEQRQKRVTDCENL